MKFLDCWSRFSLMLSCRMVFWSHQNLPVPERMLSMPDLFFDVSPIQGHGRHIWSTGGVDRFLAVKPVPHEGFNIGTVASPKLHPGFTDMCGYLKFRIPDARFTILGEWEGTDKVQDPSFNYAGKVDDVAPYLAEMDVFAYPLREDHYGTCEQVVGEAMAAGVATVLMNNPAERSIGARVIREDAQTFSDAVVRLYMMPDIRRKIAETNRKRAQELYSIDTMINRWNEVFKEMMK
jgi:glycosyltransferase involved in cell wall biosynthesis